MEERYIASIDLGTSKLGLCVARVKGDDVQVVYYKETPSEGIRDPIDSSPPGSPVPGILQARTLEWVAISFSNA